MSQTLYLHQATHAADRVWVSFMVVTQSLRYCCYHHVDLSQIYCILFIFTTSRQARSFNLSKAKATFVQNYKDAKTFENHIKDHLPCHVGIHWKALTEYCQMSTHVPGFQSFFQLFLHYFVLAISSIRINYSA